jgi:tRNA 2-thiouridine synthesizing protein A
MEMADYEVSKVVDYKGLACPMPVVHISKDINSVDVGQVIEVQTTDPGSLSDFPAWAKTTGNEIVETKQGSDVIQIYVKRAK